MRKTKFFRMNSIFGILILLPPIMTANTARAESIGFYGTKLQENATKLGSSGIVFADTIGIGDSPGLHPWNKFENCVSINECGKSDQYIYKAFAPVCSDALTTNCIADFWVEKNGKKYHPKFESYAPTQPPYEFKGDLGRNLPSSKSPSIWTIQDQAFGSDRKFFAVNLIFRGLTTFGDRTFGYSQVNASIDQIEWKRAAVKDLLPTNLEYDCAAVEEDLCAQRVEPDSKIRYGLSFRQTLSTSPWIYGRLFEPNFTLEDSKPWPQWTIEAAPLLVPSISGNISNSLINSKFPDGFRTPWGVTYLSSELNAVDLFEKLRPSMGEKSITLQSRWNFSINREDLYSRYKSCSSVGPIGFITTNANVYQGEPPRTLGTSEAVNFQSASTHFAPNGSEFRGYFQFKMDSKFANCLYSVTSGVIKADVSVIDDNGLKKIATTSFSNGSKWLTFTASNFTFSKSIFQLKIFSGKELSKKSTVTCIKGKVIKKVSAINPKCPAGYKKK